MIDIKIDNNSSSIIDLLRSFPVAAERFVGTARKRAEKGIITDLSRLIPEKYNITSGKVRNKTNVKIDKDSSVVTVSGPPMSLSNFTRAKVTKRRPAGGVSVNIKNKKKVVKGGFAARLHNGQVHIFKRKANTRLPIKKLNTVSIPQMVSEEVTNGVVEGANSRFLKSLNHELNRFLK